MSILIQNGRIVTAADDYHADVLIEGERIVQIGQGLAVEADEVIDARGKLVIPGGIDPHTHLDMPYRDTRSADDFETGTIAAAHGGTTTIIDFAVQDKSDSPLKGLDAWHEKASGKAAIDYGFHMTLTDMPRERLPEMTRLRDAGVTSYKLFMAYPGVLHVDDATLYRAFRQAGDDGTRVLMHAENGIVIDEIVAEAVRDGKLGAEQHARTRPTRMEAEGVHRAIAIAEVAGVPLYVVHLSSADALEELRRGRARGVDVVGETCPQYLFLDDSAYDAPGLEAAKYVMTPPLRARWNQDALWQGLAFRDLETIATDHCPFCLVGQKDVGVDDFTRIPNGAPGIENRMALVHHGGVVGGRISLNRFVEITSTAAAKLFGLFPRKGTLAVGSDADVVIFDPDRRETIGAGNPVTHHMNVDYSAYEGFEVQGYPETVLSRGRIVVRNQTLEQRGGGRFIARVGHGELLR